MIKLYRAEWKKTANHRWLAGFLIWIFPVGALAFYTIVVIATMFSDAAIINFGLNAVTWTDASNVWNTLSSYPGNVLGRMPILAFVATLFAGEYEWGTWKNITPRNSRSALILAKFLAFGVYVVLAFAAMSVIVGLGNGIATAIAGLPYPPAPTLDVVSAFLGDYALRAGLAFLSTLIVVSFAAFAALITRKIVGGIMIGFLISIIEPNLWLACLGLSKLFNNPDLVELYRYAPSFNIGNIDEWIRFNHALDMTPILSTQVSLGVSIVVVGLWVVGMIALVMLVFRRQDITS